MQRSPGFGERRPTLFPFLKLIWRKEKRFFFTLSNKGDWLIKFPKSNCSSDVNLEPICLIHFCSVFDWCKRQLLIHVCCGHRPPPNPTEEGESCNTGPGVFCLCYTGLHAQEIAAGVHDIVGMHFPLNGSVGGSKGQWNSVHPSSFTSGAAVFWRISFSTQKGTISRMDAGFWKD